MIDCSHANSNKDPFLQPLVLENVVSQVVDGNRSVVGVMMESNLFGGRQDIPADLSQLKRGVSVTDGCIDWETTEAAVREAAERIRGVLGGRG